MEWKNTAQVYHSTKQNSFILIAIIIIFIIIIYSLLFNKHRFRVTSSWYPWSQVRINEEVFIRKGILTLAMPWEIRIQPSFLLLVFYYYYHHISVCSTIYSCVYSYYHYLIRENLRDVTNIYIQQNELKKWHIDRSWNLKWSKKIIKNKNFKAMET